MKRTDIAMIVLIASLSAGIAYVAASSFLGSASEQTTKVKTIDSITSVIEAPDPRIFNDEAINPSVEANINDTDATAAEATPATDAPVDTANTP